MLAIHLGNKLTSGNHDFELERFTLYSDGEISDIDTIRILPVAPASSGAAVSNIVTKSEYLERTKSLIQYSVDKTVIPHNTVGKVY